MFEVDALLASNSEEKISWLGKVWRERKLKINVKKGKVMR